jgi:hypothetical protein
VLEVITQADHDVTVADAVIEWAAAHPRIQVTGGTGLTYPSVTMYADSGRARSRRVLTLYASPGGEHPVLEPGSSRCAAHPRTTRPQCTSG